MDYIKRYIEPAVVSDLERKMVFIGGLRQVGKTTMALPGCRCPVLELGFRAGQRTDHSRRIPGRSRLSDS